MKSASKVTACLLLGTALSPALAQQTGPTSAPASPTPEEPSQGVEEITVTAQRRGENLQNVPIAITAITARTLEAAGIQTTADIQRVTPGLQFQSSVGLAAPYIRGIGVAGQGAGIESSVATYVDGVYLASGGDALLSLNNIDRIEVLKGPQGTLFGRNATGGLIQIITRDPRQKFSTNGSITYDQWETKTVSAYVTGGLTDGVAADLAVRYSDQGQGWGRNRLTGDDVNKVFHDVAARSKLLIEPSDNVTIKIAGDYSNLRSSTFTVFTPVPGTVALGGVQFTGRPWDSISPFDDPLRRVRNWGVSADVTSEFSFATLHSITAYRNSLFRSFIDPGGIATPTVTIGARIANKQFSQELQLLSPATSAFKWIAGLYYFRNDSGGSLSDLGLYPALTQAPGPIFAIQNLGSVVNSLAAYGQATVAVTDRLNLTGGIRITRDKYVYSNPSTVTNLTFVPPPFNVLTVVYPDRRGTETRPSWRLAADYELAPRALAYASYNRGFKSGGYDLTSETSPELRPEVIDSYEVGTKIDAFNRTLRFNAAVFYQTISNLQLTLLNNGVQSIRNAASARAYGAEVEVTLAPVDGLTISAGGNYLHSRFRNFAGNAPISTPLPGGGNAIVGNGDASGNQTPRTPDKTFTLSANYETPLANGQLGLNGSWFRSARWYSDPDNRLFQPAYSQVAGEISWTEPSERFRFRVFGRNLTNAKVTAQFAELISGDVRSLTEPRTIGAGVDFKF